MRAADGFGAPASPIMVRLCEKAQEGMEAFGQDMQARQQEAGGLLDSALGKARGTALRISLVLEFLHWCADGGMAAPPAVISERAFTMATHFVANYLMPMAERVFGDAALNRED